MSEARSVRASGAQHEGRRSEAVGRVGFQCCAVLTVVVAGCAVTVTPQPTPSPVSDPANATLGIAGAEATATFVAGSPAGPAAIVAGWNDGQDAFAVGYLPSGGSMFERCTRRTCGAGGGPVMRAMDQAIDGATGFPAFAGDPAVAGAIGANTSSGIALAANLSTSMVPGAGVDAVVALASFDGGHRWGTTSTAAIVVNEGTGECDVRGAPALAALGSLTADRERITFDAANSSTSSATFWLVWAGPQPRLCIRSVTAAAGTLTAGPSLAAIPVVAAGFGAAIVRTFGLVVYVMYSEPIPGDCVSNNIAWHITRSIDGGASWDFPGHVVYSTSTYNGCFAFAPVAGSSCAAANDCGAGTTCNMGVCAAIITDTAQGSFGFDVDPVTGVLWAAVHDGQTSIRVRTSNNAGTTWTDSGPLNNAATFGGSPVGHPWLAVDLVGNVAVTYYQATSADGTQVERRIAVRDAAVAQWSIPVAVSPSFGLN